MKRSSFYISTHIDVAQGIRIQTFYPACLEHNASHSRSYVQKGRVVVVEIANYFNYKKDF